MKKAWNSVVNFVKHLFAKKATSVEVLELVNRIIALEAINKQNEEYRKNKVRKFNNKKKDKSPLPY